MGSVVTLSAREPGRDSGPDAVAAQVPERVSWAAFRLLMREYVESEGKNPTDEVLDLVCLTWLEMKRGLDD